MIMCRENSRSIFHVVLDDDVPRGVYVDTYSSHGRREISSPIPINGCIGAPWIYAKFWKHPVARAKTQT